MSPGGRVQPRFLVAIGLTVVALVVLAVVSLRRPGPAREPATSAPATTERTTTTMIGTSTTVEIPADWYPKGSSRYSDREPHTSLTTLAPTTTDKERR